MLFHVGRTRNIGETHLGHSNDLHHYRHSTHYFWYIIHHSGILMPQLCLMSGILCLAGGDLIAPPLPPLAAIYIAICISNKTSRDQEVYLLKEGIRGRAEVISRRQTWFYRTDSRRSAIYST